MAHKKFTPSPAKIETAYGLANAPGRDDKAMTLPVSALIIKTNPRSNLGDLTELKDSIADRGILNPLLVINTLAGWELIGGHRRLECARELGMVDVPCRVVVSNEPEIIKILDNIMREALSPQDECIALKRLLSAFAGNQSALARALSKSPSYVNRAVRAADLIESGLCAGAQLSKTALMELADSPDPRSVLAAAADGTKEAIRQARADIEDKARRQSGPLPGGRSVAQTFHFRERRDGKAFSLRVNFDAEKTPPGTREEIIRKLEAILVRLRS
jgi:ParB family chromosome partitioning protein